MFLESWHIQHIKFLKKEKTDLGLENSVIQELALNAWANENIVI